MFVDDSERVERGNRMSVAEAVAARRSCRAFLSDVVDTGFVRDVLV